MRVAELYTRRQQRIVTMVETAEMLGVMERMFRRWSGPRSRFKASTRG